MNAMGHNLPSMIGVDHKDVADKINKLIPSYMTMGDKGMADMGAMEMPLPDNTIPMMTGEGPFGGLEMGGMFSVVKVRRGQKPGDYKDPGWYQHPKVTVAYEYGGPVSDAPRQPPDVHTRMGHAQPELEVQVRKPQAHGSH